MALDIGRLGGLDRLDVSDDHQPECQRELWLCPHESLDFGEAQKLLATRGTRKTCGAATCRDTFTQVFVTHKRSASGRRLLQLITSVSLFDIPCPDDPKEACKLYCSLDRIATALNGLDIPICPHLNLSSSFLLTQLDLQYIPILEANTYIDKYHYHPRSNLPLSNPRSPCRHTAHCLVCFDSPLNIKTAFHLQASKAAPTRLRKPPQLTIRLNISRNLGTLPYPSDPPWLTHTSTPARFHHLVSAWQEWDDKFSALQHLRRDWLNDLIPVHQKIQGEVFDGKETHPLALRLLGHQSDRGDEYWKTIRDSFTQQRQWMRIRRMIRQAAKEQFNDVAAAPDAEKSVLSVRRLGLWRTVKAVWGKEREMWSCARKEWQQQRWGRGRTDDVGKERRAARDSGIGESSEVLRLKEILELREADEA